MGCWGKTDLGHPAKSETNCWRDTRLEHSLPGNKKHAGTPGKGRLFDQKKKKTLDDAVCEPSKCSFVSPTDLPVRFCWISQLFVGLETAKVRSPGKGGGWILDTS